MRADILDCIIFVSDVEHRDYLSVYIHNFSLALFYLANFSDCYFLHTAGRQSWLLIFLENGTYMDLYILYIILYRLVLAQIFILAFIQPLAVWLFLGQLLEYMR